MYQVAYIGNDSYFDVKFVVDAEVNEYVKALYREQICSIAKDYVRQNLDDFEFKEGSWEKVVCANGEIIPKDIATELEGFGYVRTSELANYKKCDLCGKYHNVGTSYEVTDMETHEVIHICYSCRHTSDKVIACPHCGRLYYNGEFTDRISRMYVCYRCAESCETDECECCGERFFVGGLHYDIDDRLVCCECDDFDDDGYIDGYHHDRDLDKLYLASDSTEDRKKMIGIELEIGRGPSYDNALAKYCIDQMDGNLVCKEDGSINGYGFEMVTNPMSYNYYETTMPAWSNILAKCEKRGFQSGTNANTGMHVHINRPWFGPAEVRDMNIDKMLYLFEGFWDNILKFANRSASRANEWAGRYVNGTGKKYKKEEIKTNSRRGNRYRAVNLCNSGTVEIRIFNGTLNEKQFFANVQLVKRLMDIVTTFTDEDFYELTWRDIVNGDSQYTYLIERGNSNIGPNPDTKLKEYFDDMEADEDGGAWKEFPVGTMVHVNIDPDRSYSCGLCEEMLEFNGQWIRLGSDVERNNWNGDVLYIIEDYYFCLEMFDDYRLPSGTNLTINIPAERYYREINITRYMYGHSGETRRVADHLDDGLRLTSLRNVYDRTMFRELTYINSRLGGAR